MDIQGSSVKIEPFDPEGQTDLGWSGSILAPLHDVKRGLRCGSEHQVAGRLLLGPGDPELAGITNCTW